MMQPAAVIRDLGDGLVLRQATIADIDSVVVFNTHVHSEGGWDAPDRKLGFWVRDLITGNHPTMAVGDFLIVEDTATGEIVSSTNLIPQTWSYAGVEFGVGRPELVGTHPDYRRRGLVRAQFEVLHRWSEDRGHKVQAITGIPWYYRQFGYDMVLDMHGSRRGPVSSVPKLKEGQAEPYAVRLAQVSDLAFIAEVSSCGDERSLVSCRRDAAQWRYELDGQATESFQARQLCIIETTAGEPVGFLARAMMRWGSAVYLTRYELKAGVSWWDATPSVLRYLKEAGAAMVPYAESPDGGPVFDTIIFGLGREHPCYEIVADWLPRFEPPFAWYLRVLDVPDFLRLIAPVLEQRLAASIFVGHTGALKIDFYRGGVQIKFEAGRVVEVAPWAAQVGGDRGMVRFPDLTFLQVLFGYRSLEEVQHAYADCGGTLEGRLLTKALFPKSGSTVWPLA
jgi:GNAT superfamily N-acetyltransferase